MSILNVNTIQPVGSGQTITVSAANISAPSTVVTASSFVGNVRATNITGVSTAGITTAYIGVINDGPLSGTRNRIINGAMDIWQRGTSFSNMGADTSYTADRWSCYRDAYASGITVSQVTGLSQNGNNRIALRCQRTNGNTSTAGLSVTQSLETINSRDLAGQTVTLSFWARAGSNFSSSGNQLFCFINSGTGTDQALRGAVTGFDGYNEVKILTTSFQRFTVTRTIPSNSNQIFVAFNYPPTGTAGSNDFFDIMDVQLEPGPIATPFERRSFGQELALCQRYFNRIEQGVPGAAISGTTAHFSFQSVPMRVSPNYNLSAAAKVDWPFNANYTQSSANISENFASSNGTYNFALGNFTGLTLHSRLVLRNDGGAVSISAEI